MSAEEFWHGEPQLAVSYREAEKIKRENRYVSEWRAGYYVYRAVAANLSKDKEAEYPPEPLFSTMLDDEHVQEQREKAAMDRAVAGFEAMAAKLNANLTASGGLGDEG